MCKAADIPEIYLHGWVQPKNYSTRNTPCPPSILSLSKSPLLRGWDLKSSMERHWFSNFCAHKVSTDGSWDDAESCPTWNFSIITKIYNLSSLPPLPLSFTSNPALPSPPNINIAKFLIQPNLETLIFDCIKFWGGRTGMLRFGSMFSTWPKVSARVRAQEPIKNCRSWNYYI